VSESGAERRERLYQLVRDNHARQWHERLPQLLKIEISPDSRLDSSDVADLERLVGEQCANFGWSVSRWRWTTDLLREALAKLRRFAAILGPVI
jgi:hypothetical protein